METALSEFNLIILKNNQRTSDFEIKKNLASEKLKEHFAAEFETTESYSTIQSELKNEQLVITECLKKIGTQKELIGKIKSQLDETVKGAGKVNDYLSIFFGKDDIKIELTPDKKFKLVRGTDIAKNLSEGEKTAISFAYFTAKLEELNNRISETIIYIDDPISSLDSHHLFNIYSFIKNTFYELKKDPTTNKNIHVNKCKQLFISTHNFEFYNLVYDWFSKTKKNFHSFYLVERIKNSHRNESIVKESNDFIGRYKSEYVYLFSIIYKFHQNPADTFEQLYHLPNILRRFVEAYLKFKFLSVNVDENIADLIIDPVECERARKFMHYYSHGLTIDKVAKFADLSECIDVVKIIIESIKNNDITHYDSLNLLVSSN